MTPPASVDVDAERVAKGTAGSMIVLHATGLSGGELALRSREARRALAWVGLQDPDIIAGFCELIEAARDAEARGCGS